MKSRRIFLKITIAGILSFFVFIWNKLTLKHIAGSDNSRKVFPFQKNKLVTFIDEYIVITKSNKTTVYSAHCTHLGCKIDKIKDERFICPCHGSEYDLNGKVTKGPAFKDLKVLTSKISENGKNIEITS